MVTLEYRDEANSYFCTTQLYLNPEEGGWHQVWSLPLVDPAQRTFRYKWLRCSKDGGVTESTVVPGNQQGWLTASGNEVITIGDPNSDEDMLRVHVDPLVFTVGLGEGKKVVRALVHMKYKDTLTGVVDTDDHTFSLEDQKAWLWTEHIRDLAHPNAKKYEWSATYYTAPYSRIDIGPFTDQEAETVVLEPPPA